MALLPDLMFIRLTCSCLDDLEMFLTYHFLRPHMSYGHKTSGRQSRIVPAISIRVESDDGLANSDNFRVNARVIDSTLRVRPYNTSRNVRLISSIIPSLPNLIAAIQVRHWDWWRLARICSLQCQLPGPLLKSRKRDRRRRFQFT